MQFLASPQKSNRERRILPVGLFLQPVYKDIQKIGKALKTAKPAINALLMAKMREADVPRAMAEALRSGNLGVMDYYRMQNVLADTEMKKGIGNGANTFADSKKSGMNND